LLRFLETFLKNFTKKIIPSQATAAGGLRRHSANLTPKPSGGVMFWMCTFFSISGAQNFWT